MTVTYIQKVRVMGHYQNRTGLVFDQIGLQGQTHDKNNGHE